MTIDTDKITTLVERILAVARPEKIILFGSAALGTMTRDSDIDLLVIEHNIVDERRERIRLRRAVGDIGLPVDVFTMTPERFEETRNVIGGLAYPANKYGKLIYEIA